MPKIRRHRKRSFESSSPQSVSRLADESCDQTALDDGGQTSRLMPGHSFSRMTVDIPREGMGAPSPSNAAVRPIQGYFNSNNFAMGPHATFIDQPIRRGNFETEYQAPVTKTQHDYLAMPNLNISEGRRLAIEAGAQQPKVIYGDAQVPVESNAKLEGAGVDLRLQADPNRSITIPPRVPVELPVTLNQIKPIIPNPDVDDAMMDLTGFSEHECNRVIDNIIGASHRVTVLAGDREKAGDSSAAYQVGDYLGRQIAGNRAVRVQDARDHDPPTQNTHAMKDMADKYANVDPANTANERETLGINEYAVPEVGEGYLIKSLSHEGTDDVMNATFDSQQDQLLAIQGLGQAQQGIDIMRQQVSVKTKALMNRWNEHFAGVVAKDGADTVTLENYNRRVELAFEFTRIFNNLFQQFQEFRDLVWSGVNQLDPPRPIMDFHETQRFVTAARESIQEMQLQQQMVSLAYSQAVNQAHQAMETLLGVNDNGGPTDLIYFRMYGPGDQSFHEQWKGVADNPLTVRIRSSTDLKRRELMTRRQTLIDSLSVILGDPQAKAPFFQIYANFARLGNQWSDLYEQQIQNAGTIHALNQAGTAMNTAFTNLRRDLRQAIADAVKTAVNDQGIQNPVDDTALVQMVETQIEANNYSSFDFSESGYQKADRYKKLQILLPAAIRLRDN